ncbi:MAG: DnaD domain protein [Halanaerobiales bacterium]|nr:DnaD domain protein [Halanaerobiales bacterium]
MDNIKFIEHKKIRICCDDEKQSVELGKKSIINGLLKSLPGPSLPVIIYLLTHLGHENSVKTNPAIMAGFLALDRENIKKGLSILEKNGFINIKKDKEGDYRTKIILDLDKLANSCDYKDNILDKKNSKSKNNVSINSLESNDLKKSLLNFLPKEVNQKLIDEEIDQWINDFEPKIIKELIRRVKKWSTNNNKDNKEVFYYLHGIVDDWYSKNIFTYDRLKHFDRMFRETNQLAKCYGLKNWYNVNESQMEIFYSWLNNGDGINLSVAKFAIKEAFKRKSDGQPSLKYIEDNFITPLKESKIKNIKQAKKLFNQDLKEMNTKKSNHDQNKWENFKWDIEDLN